MNKTNDIAVLLNSEIKKTEEFKTYLNSLKLIKKHSELFELEKELKTYQQEILKERTKQDGDSYELEVIYRKKMEQFKQHPLIINYLNDKEELASLVSYIQTYIQGLLDEAS